MRIRTMVGLGVAGAAATAAIVGGVANAAADDEPIVRIVTEESSAGTAGQPEDCPEDDVPAPSTPGAGL